MDTKKCCTCKLTKAIEDFGDNRSKKDGKQNYCKTCGKDYDKRHYVKNEKRREKIGEARKQSRLRNRIFVIKYLLAHPCLDCGETNPLFLEFDHISGNKILEVGSMVHGGWSLENIMLEIDKCEVRCVKCHKIQTAKRAGWYDSYKELISLYSASGNTPLL